VNFLVSDVAQKTFENQKSKYVLAFKSKIAVQNEYTESIAKIFAQNKEIARAFVSGDDNASKMIQANSRSLEEKLHKTLDKKSVHIYYNEIKKAESISGIDVNKKGVTFKSVMPMINKNGTIIAVVVEKDMNSLKEIYKREHKEFAFFLTENSMHKLDRDVKKRDYESYHNKFYIKKVDYDQAFLQKLKTTVFDEKLKENGYLKDSQYFYVYEKVYDIDGDLAGIAVVAEETKDENSFVNLVKNLVNSVTMVALGLIVSMLLFLF
jgi:hypothetical protein